MIVNTFVGSLLVVGIAFIVVVVIRVGFTTRLDAIEIQLRGFANSQMARSDLPAEVISLAERMGARSDSTSQFVVSEQSGRCCKSQEANHRPSPRGRQSETTYQSFFGVQL